MNKKLFLAAAVFSSAIASAYAADAQQSVKAFYYDLSDPYIREFSNKLTSEAKDNNIDLKGYNGGDDSYAQIMQLETAYVTKSPMVVNLVDRNYAEEVLNKVGPDIKVVFFNREPPRSALRGHKNVWYVGADPAQSGIYQGEMIVDYLKQHPDYDKNGNGKLDVVILKGQNGHQDTEMRTTAVTSVLYKNGIKLNRVASVTADWSFEKGIEETDRILMQYDPDDIEMIISNNDAMALGAITTLNQHGYNEGDKTKYIPVFGIDAIPNAVTAVEQGKLTGTVRNDADRAADVTMKILKADTSDPVKMSEILGLKVDKDGYVMVPYQKLSK